MTGSDTMTPCREQVLLVSAQPIPNLIPVLKWRPEAVHLLVSEKMGPQADRLERYLEGLTINVLRHAIDAYNQEQVQLVCRDILADKEAGSVLLNATGGTKVAAFAAFEAFRSVGFPVVYFDPQRWRILSLYPGQQEPVRPEGEISVTEYLSVYGLNVKKAERSCADMERRLSLSRFLARELPGRPGFMRVLNAVAARAVNLRSFPFTEKIEPFSKDYLPLLTRLDDEGLIGWDGASRKITFPCRGSARYLNGFWLEEYVFASLEGLPIADSLRNVEVEWDGTGRSPVENEFDVVFTRGARLYLISCKTASLSRERDTIDKNPLYELFSLKESAAGLFGRGLLVSASPMGEALKKRAGASGIDYLEGTELPYLREKIQAMLDR